MAFNRDIHHRKSIRLHGYDYPKPGAYFITICTHQRQPLFGDVEDGNMMLNAAGVMVEKCWWEISDHFPWVRLGEFIVMPNHAHGIVHVGAQFIAPHNCNQYAINSGAINRAPTVGGIVRNFKARCTHGANQLNCIMSNTKLFHDQKICSHWDTEQEQWFFSFGSCGVFWSCFDFL